MMRKGRRVDRGALGPDEKSGDEKRRRWGGQGATRGGQRDPRLSAPSAGPCAMRYLALFGPQNIYSRFSMIGPSIASFPSTTTISTGSSPPIHLPIPPPTTPLVVA